MGYSQKVIYAPDDDTTVVKNIFSQTQQVTVGNTATETSLLGAGVGNLTLPINFFTDGKSLTFELSGYISANNNVSSTVNIKIGNTTYLTNTSSFTASATGVLFKAFVTLTYHNGNLLGQGYTNVFGGQGFATLTARPLMMTVPVAINNAIENTINVTYKWGTASTANTITATNVIINSVK